MVDEINFGDEVLDGITGFSGLVTGKCQYITGCDQVLITPRMSESGEFRESKWFDVDRIRVIVEQAYQLASHTSNGPDLPAPVK